MAPYYCQFIRLGLIPTFKNQKLFAYAFEKEILHFAEQNKPNPFTP